MTGYLGGFGLWCDLIIGTKNQDIALIYTVIINVVIFVEKRSVILHEKYRTAYICLLLFLLFSVLFSCIYYGLSLLQVIRGGRVYLLLLSLPILISVRKNELKRIVGLLFIICIVQSVIYILQTLLGRPLMPYVSETTIDFATGLPRFYNAPANLAFFLALSFINSSSFPKQININLIRTILFVAQLCTLGRNSIFVCILTVFLSLMLNGNLKKFAKSLVIVLIILVPFIDIISQRYERGNTSEDIELISEGRFANNYVQPENATMLFRIALCYERGEYLIKRPFGEQLFGMGLASDSDPWVQKKYHFSIGLINEETGNINQLANPDIAYGNLISYLGFGGMIIYLWFYVCLTMYYWKNKKENAYYTVITSQLIMMFVGSFSGIGLSNPKAFTMFFLFLSMTRSKKYLNFKNILLSDKRLNANES